MQIGLYIYIYITIWIHAILRPEYDISMARIDQFYVWVIGWWYGFTDVGVRTLSGGPAVLT